jgi:hypothetical protein
VNDGVIIQQAYNKHEWNDDYHPALELVRERHQAYADKWKFDYLVVFGEVRLDWEVSHGGWAKLELVRQMLAKGYKYVVWVDADAMIVDMNTDLREGCPEGLGMVVHNGAGTPGPHMNVGVMLMQNSERVRAFFDEWVTRYPGTTEFPWYEQGEAHKMAHDPKWAGVVIEIDKRWNSCVYAETHVNNAVIEGWHGMGTPAQRTEQMRTFLDLLNKSGIESGLIPAPLLAGEVKEK